MSKDVGDKFVTYLTSVDVYQAVVFKCIIQLCVLMILMKWTILFISFCLSLIHRDLEISLLSRIKI